MLSYKHIILLAITLLLLTSPTFTQEVEDESEYLKAHKCTHDLEDHPEPELIDVDEVQPFDSEGRALASYNNIRMHGYYGALGSASSSFKSYLQNTLVPPILDYFRATLKVKYPTAGKLSKTGSTVCGVANPSILKNGIATDFFLIVQGDMDNSGSWVASSRACYLSSGSKRPYIAIMTVNNALLKATSNVLLHEKNMICLMHEVIHTLGFSRTLYSNFLTSSGTRRSGHVSSATLGGSTSIVLNAEPLTNRIRSHFGCSTLKGAYMENTGSTSTAGSHFERRQFSFEIMTSGLIYEMAVSQFTLALLESSGWYIPNYDYADNFHWGKGQGCNFLTKSCSGFGSTYDEFCTGSSRGCAYLGRGGGSCSSDTRSDGCKFVHPNVAYDCENPDGDSNARLPDLQVYGRGKGSKCFEGTLSTASSASKTSFCFKYTCSGSTLTLHVGSKSVVCSSAGPKSVSGYKGTINCPDPVDYCSTVGKKRCPRNCMGRGTCNNGVCSCSKGSGTDCSAP